MASSDLLLQSQGNQLQVAHAQKKPLSEKGQAPLCPGQQSGHCDGTQTERQEHPHTFPTRKEGDKFLPC